LKKILRYLVLSALIFSIAICSTLATPMVDVIDTPPAYSGGIYTYSYALSVAPSSPDNVWEFWIYPKATFTNVSQIIDSSDPQNPLVLWDFITDGSSFIQWYSTDPSGTYDITPGNSRGFSFDSFGAPGIVNYDIGGSDPDGIPTDSISGTTTGPVEPIPEPSTVLLLATGLVGMAGYVRIRFKRK